MTRKKCRYGCTINQVTLFSTHGAWYGNIPEGQWAEPQLQPPKRSSQAEIHDRHVWLCLCLLPPHLWGVGLGSVVGAGLIRDGVCPCVGFVRGRQRGLRRWGRTSTSAGATPCSSSAVQRPLLACNYPLLQAKSGIRFLIRGCLHGELAYEFLSHAVFE